MRTFLPSVDTVLGFTHSWLHFTANWADPEGWILPSASSRKRSLSHQKLAAEELCLFCVFLSCHWSAKDHLTKLQQDLWNDRREGSTCSALVPCWACSCWFPKLLQLHAFLCKERAVLKSELLMEKQQRARCAGKEGQMWLSHHFFCVRGLNGWESQRERQMGCICLSSLPQS